VNKADVSAGISPRQSFDSWAKFVAELERIGVPALIVASELDQHCPPKAAEIIASGIKGSQLEIIAGAGHPIPVEKPCELARMINSFLAHID